MSDTCPGCDGTLTRALREGRPIGTHDPCSACQGRLEAVDWSQVFVPHPIVRRATEPGDNQSA